MKRALVLVLALGLLLTGCQRRTEPTEPLEPPSAVDTSLDPIEVAVTAEDLLEAGYGVDELNSWALDIAFRITSSESSKDYHISYEQAENMLHLAVSELDKDGSSVEALDTYYDLDDQTYFYQEDGAWCMESLPTYNAVFDRLSEIPLSELIENPELTESDDCYYISGLASHGIVFDLAGIMYDGELSNVERNVFFTYDKETKVLKNMLFEINDGVSSVIIDMDILGINAVSMMIPFDINTIGEEIGYGDEEDIWDTLSGKEEGEKYLAEEYFDTDYVRESDFIAGLPEQYRGIHEGVLYMARYYYNSYSREGFIRMLSASKPSIDEEYMAAVLVCELTGIPLETLWENGFMSQDDVTNAKAELMLGGTNR